MKVLRRTLGAIALLVFGGLGALFAHATWVHRAEYDGLTVMSAIFVLVAAIYITTLFLAIQEWREGY